YTDIQFWLFYLFHSIYVVLISASRAPRALHSFPTRRSSDLASGVFASTHYHHRPACKGRRPMSFVRPRLPQPAQQLYPAPDGLARGRPDGEHSVGGATVSVQESVLSPPRVCRTFPSIGPYPCASDRTAGKPADPDRCLPGR